MNTWTWFELAKVCKLKSHWACPAGTSFAGVAEAESAVLVEGDDDDDGLSWLAKDFESNHWKITNNLLNFTIHDPQKWPGRPINQSGKAIHVSASSLASTLFFLKLSFRQNVREITIHAFRLESLRTIWTSVPKRLQVPVDIFQNHAVITSMYVGWISVVSTKLFGISSRLFFHECCNLAWGSRLLCNHERTSAAGFLPNNVNHIYEKSRNFGGPNFTGKHRSSRVKTALHANFTATSRYGILRFVGVLNRDTVHYVVFHNIMCYPYRTGVILWNSNWIE